MFRKGLKAACLLECLISLNFVVVNTDDLRVSVETDSQ